MYRAFSYSFAKSFPILSNGFEIETEMSIHAADKSFQVENVVVGYRDRPEGSQSKLNTVRDGIKVIRTIVRLTRDYRPMLFFGTIAIVLMLLAVLFFVPVLAAFLRTGMVGRIPTLLVCGFVFMAGMLSAVAGILLETIRQKDKRDFTNRRRVRVCFFPVLTMKAKDAQSFAFPVAYLASSFSLCLILRSAFTSIFSLRSASIVL